MINTRFLATAFLLLSCSPAYAQVERVWLSHRTNDPSKLVVNWMTKEPGESVVRYGRTSSWSYPLNLYRVEWEFNLAES